MRCRRRGDSPAAAIVLAWIAVAGCQGDRHGAPRATSTQQPEKPDVPPPQAPRLESPLPIVPLPVAGFPDAVVSIPICATAPRPVIVATHGMWDFPEGLCDNWRWIVGDRAWVLCPRGDPMPDKTFRYKSGPALAKEIDSGLQALEQQEIKSWKSS